ncbi:hypothetical protein CHX27_07425 [Flavobacterium aurantiibacter]|uniref:Uncharacterized protein n=1 Tax=Flavobacterium aurantiibacter TaxID=2023067 RepID=A0A255ZSL1_9FLAO|nr:hypothetical protein CHX27_07425 [Flavobacterium aurantiibacter]
MCQLLITNLNVYKRLNALKIRLAKIDFVFLNRRRARGPGALLYPFYDFCHKTPFIIEHFRFIKFYAPITFFGLAVNLDVFAIFDVKYSSGLLARMDSISLFCV